jgi:hypothetical protein
MARARSAAAYRLSYCNIKGKAGDGGSDRRMGAIAGPASPKGRTGKMDAPVLNRLIGNFDRMVGDRTVCGWTVDKSDPDDRNIEVVVTRDSRSIGSAFARMRRDDGYHGYMVACSEEVAPWEILAKRVEVVARNSAGAQTRLHIHEPLLEQFAHSTFERLIMPSATEAVAQEIRASLRDLFGTGPGNAPARLRVRVQSAEDVSHLGLPVGLLSADNSGVIGRGGQLFLHQGSNCLLDQYNISIDNPGLRAKGDSWATLIRARLRTVQGQEKAFLQTIVPEKSSVLPELFPFDIHPPTPLLRSVEQGLVMDPDVGKTYVSAIQLLTNDTRRLEAFPRTDSHMSPYGCLVLFRRMLAAFEEQRPGSVPNSLTLALTVGSCKSHKTRLISGDLTRRFFGVPMYETEDLPVSVLMLEEYGAALESIYEFNPPKGQIGARYAWRNPLAPIKHRVIAFGSSSFGHGRGPQNLSWWFKHCFEEFHFVWGGAYLQELVNETKPSLVVCQTVERFLDRLAPA